MAACAEPNIGSGVRGKQLDSVYCANLGNCNNLGCKSCKNCKLVAYCSKECQTQDWKLHKSLCKSPLMQDSWSPCWIKESRTPSFMDSEPDINHHHVSPECSPHPLQEECLWGNVPAYGMIGSAEGHVLPDHLRICFVASGDLRNVVETVCQIPDDFKGKATFYVNDRNAKVMVRNFLMLELLKLHGSQAIDAVIALWYSVALTSAQLKAMTTLARRVQRWALEQEAADMSEYSGSVGSSEERSVIARFGKLSLQMLWLLCENGISLARAKETRTALMKSRPDLVDRRMSCLRPAHRVAWFQFRKTGILLPFASQCAETDDHYDKANRFLLSPTLGWTLGDGNDPLDGWDMKQLIPAGVRRGVPFNDLYGCLFYHVRSRLQSFLDKWQRCRITFVLSNVDASELAADLRCRKVRFHRIDTSNLADEHFKGIKSVLTDWGPLLTRSWPSLHAVEPLLVTYFMNWAHFYNKRKSSTAHHSMIEDNAQRLVEPAITAAEFAQAMLKGARWGLRNPGFKELSLRLLLGGDGNWYTYFHDFSKAFDEYLGSMQGALRAAQKVGVERMPKHVTVPHRLFVGVSASTSTTPALHGDLEDFYMCNVLQFNRTMTERFVEWTKT